MSENPGEETGPGDGNQVPEFWFNTKTKSVEKGLLTAAPFRIGPFKSEAEAANALEIIRRRAKAWQDEDDRESR